MKFNTKHITALKEKDHTSNQNINTNLANKVANDNKSNLNSLSASKRYVYIILLMFSLF